MKTIGKYQIINILGKGAMGIVYKALDPDINRDVAIKTIRFDLVSDEKSESEEMMQRFMREAQAAGKMTHPNIITIFDVGREGNLTYIVMQFIKGKSLQQLIASGEKLPTEKIIEVMGQLCDALDYAHKNGIVHRDVKPANILLDESGKPYIVDFGVARVETSTLTQTGTAVGTPSYMSPEQVMGKKVDSRSDIFSLGSILYEFLTGKRPFDGESITTVIYKIVNEEPLSLTEIKKDLPAGFEHALSKALAKNPDDRYQSCKELAKDLGNIGQVAEETMQMSDRTIAISPAVEEPAVSEEKKKSKLGLVLAVSLSTLILGGAAFVYFQGEKIPFLAEKLPFLAKRVQATKTKEPSTPPESTKKALTTKTGKVTGKKDVRKKTESPSVSQPEKTKPGAIEAKLKETESPPSPKSQKVTAPPQEEKPVKAREEKPKESKVSPEPKKVTPKPKEEREVKKTKPTSKPKKVVPGSIEDKLIRAKASFDQGDYNETKRLTEEVLSEDANNKTALEYLNMAKNKINEELIAQTLTTGISHYEKGNYTQCIREMDKILKLDNEHQEALNYKSLANEAINATQEIRKIIFRQKKAEEEQDLLTLIADIGSKALETEKMENAKFIINNYKDLQSVIDENSISIKFINRNRAQVEFYNISTAVNKITGRNEQVFEGVKVWVMTKQGRAWKIISERKK